VSALDRVLARLPNAKRSGKNWQAKCPAHDDKTPSLSISQGKSGVLLKCWAGCELDRIAAALRLDMRELFDDADKPRAAPGFYAPVNGPRNGSGARVEPIASSEAVVETQRAKPLEWWQCGPPHDDDPLWRPFCECALQEIVWERYGLDASLSVATLDDKIDAQDRAASWIHHEGLRPESLALLPERDRRFVVKWRKLFPSPLGLAHGDSNDFLARAARLR